MKEWLRIFKMYMVVGLVNIPTGIIVGMAIAKGADPKLVYTLGLMAGFMLSLLVFSKSRGEHG